MERSRQFRLIAPFVLCALLFHGVASGNVMLHPTRIVLEKNQRAAQLELINHGSETVTYRIHLVNRRMSETGEFTAVKTPAPGEQFADQMLRYSPRQVVLEPGASQVVRIMVRKPANLAPGEYRSHLHFEQIKGGGPTPQPRSQPDKSVQIQLIPLVGVSIPVIVRHSETAANVRLQGLQIEQAPTGEAVLALEMHREGSRSVYGDLIVTFTPEGGEARQMARVNGVAVYTPNLLRRAKLALQQRPVGPGVLRALYLEQPANGGKPIAEASLQVR